MSALGPRWYWWLNPWLYLARIDRAYRIALDIIREQAIEIDARLLAYETEDRRAERLAEGGR